MPYNNEPWAWFHLPKFKAGKWMWLSVWDLLYSWLINNTYKGSDSSIAWCVGKSSKNMMIAYNWYDATSSRLYVLLQSRIYCFVIHLLVLLSPIVAVDGACYGLAKGDIEVTLQVGACDGFGATDAWTGFVSSRTVLVMEVIAQQALQGKAHKVSDTAVMEFEPSQCFNISILDSLYFLYCTLD